MRTLGDWRTSLPRQHSTVTLGQSMGGGGVEVGGGDATLCESWTHTHKTHSYTMEHYISAPCIHTHHSHTPRPTDTLTDIHRTHTQRTCSYPYHTHVIDKTHKAHTTHTHKTLHRRSYITHCLCTSLKMLGRCHWPRWSTHLTTVGCWWMLSFFNVSRVLIFARIFFRDLDDINKLSRNFRKFAFSRNSRKFVLAKLSQNKLIVKFSKIIS